MQEKTTEERIEEVRKLIAEGSCYLSIMSRIRELEALPQSSAEMPKLRKDAYALFYQQDMKGARTLLELRDPYAKSLVRSAKAYIKMSGSSVPEELYELESQVKVAFP